MKEDSDNGHERLSSGVAGLDIILGGGILAGGLYTIQGQAGAGKTTLHA
jgi:circadian clock protein KaiC